ncbi:MAG: precorrin-4 C(11)-methyltransferase [Magnetospirillum sp. WYHS-4]
MTVHFIGAGPGAPDLITVRGLNIIRRCPVVLYAGSLVPKEVIAEAPKFARVVDTSSLTLGEIVEEMCGAHAVGQDVARVHSGDPSIYGAVAEQMRRLDELNIPYDVTPGVPSFAAAAAALRRELTLPEVCQTVVLTRTDGRSSPMPAGEDIKVLARTGATLAIHLSAAGIAKLAEDLAVEVGGDCPIAIIHKASWPDQQVIRGTLADIAAKAKEARIERTAMVLVGKALAAEGFADSKLYAPDHHHAGRKAKTSAKKK